MVPTQTVARPIVAIGAQLERTVAGQMQAAIFPVKYVVVSRKVVRVEGLSSEQFCYEPLISHRMETSSGAMNTSPYQRSYLVHCPQMFAPHYHYLLIAKFSAREMITPGMFLQVI